MMEREGSEPPVPPPSEQERAEAEDATPQDAPADPVEEPDTEGSADAESEPESEPGSEPESEPEPEPESEPESEPSSEPASEPGSELPRTTTTGDEEYDRRSAGDGAVSGAPGDDLDDASQRHD